MTIKLTYQNMLIQTHFVNSQVLHAILNASNVLEHPPFIVRKCLSE